MTRPASLLRWDSYGPLPSLQKLNCWVLLLKQTPRNFSTTQHSVSFHCWSTEVVSLLLNRLSIFSFPFLHLNSLFCVWKLQSVTYGEVWWPSQLAVPTHYFLKFLSCFQQFSLGFPLTFLITAFSFSESPFSAYPLNVWTLKSSIIFLLYWRFNLRLWRSVIPWNFMKILNILQLVKVVKNGFESCISFLFKKSYCWDFYNKCNSSVI